VSEKLPESAQAVQEVLRAKGIDARVMVLPQSTRTAKEAAEAVGCEVAQIAKSIIFKRADTQQAVLVITSGVNRVDEKRIAAHLGTPLLKADADFVRAATGYAIGGVPPLGHRAPIETLIDETLLALDSVWAAAGTPNALFSIGSRQLVAATGGHVMGVA
jgi:prolyl-tRNA editing enzyme YbaK/EbsC (Cys-tRNA(Pro) deacylase)